MSFARGFKASAERLADELRSQAGVPADGAADLEAIAGVLGARIVAADTLVARGRLVELKAIQPDAFSACTFSLPECGAVVVYNPLNAPERRNSDLAHELAHLALGHALRRIERLGAFSFLTCDADQEAEAQWLAAAMLLPRPLMLHYWRAGVGPEEIAARFGVSLQIVAFRINATGVALQHGRERRRQARG